jgi:hypothetical protein
MFEKRERDIAKLFDEENQSVQDTLLIQYERMRSGAKISPIRLKMYEFCLILIWILK